MVFPMVMLVVGITPILGIAVMMLVSDHYFVDH